MIDLAAYACCAIQRVKLIFVLGIINLFLIFMASTVNAQTGASADSEAVVLKPFTSDGCSGFPDGTFDQQQLWLACCTAHDLAYWQGGSYKERQQADTALQQCVANIGQPDIANIMLTGVRVGGTPYLPTQFRWGYGWPFPRGYKALTEKERAMIDRAHPQTSVDDRDSQDQATPN